MFPLHRPAQERKGKTKQDSLNDESMSLFTLSMAKTPVALQLPLCEPG